MRAKVEHEDTTCEFDLVLKSPKPTLKETDNADTLLDLGETQCTLSTGQVDAELKPEDTAKK